MAAVPSVDGLSGRSVLPDSTVCYSFGFVFISVVQFSSRCLLALPTVGR